MPARLEEYVKTDPQDSISRILFLTTCNAISPNPSVTEASGSDCQHSWHSAQGPSTIEQQSIVRAGAQLPGENVVLMHKWRTKYLHIPITGS